VTAVLVTEGEIASGVAVQLADAANLEVVLNVDEIDLATLSIGQPATITFDSFPDVEIPAEVASIAPRGRTAASGIVTYDVRLALGETDAPLRLNMTANANLVTDQREDVLLAPNRAIQVDRGSGTYSVNRVIGAGQTEQVTVTIGLRDNQYTQITSGLEEGDEVVIGNAAPAVNIENLFGGG
jgi:multidrug efflux pump subunit AcrA (membrane-fusion protein)